MAFVRANRLFLMGLLVPAFAGFRTISNGDFWLHLALGRAVATSGIPHTGILSYTMASEPWVNKTWLYDLMLYRLWQTGESTLVIAAHVLAVTGAFALMMACVRKTYDGGSIALALITSAWILAPRFSPSPMLVGLLYPALFVFILTHARRAWIAWTALLPLQWLWTAMHSSFLLGPALCLLYGAGRQVEGPESQARLSARSLYALSIATFILTFANPYGAHLHRYVMTAVGAVGATYVQEWISPFSWRFIGSWPRHAVTFGLIVGALGLVTERRRLPVTYTTMAIFGAVLVVLQPHAHNEVFALLACPFLALSFDAVTTWVGGRLERYSLLPQPGVRLVAFLGVVASLAMLVSNRYYRTAGSASAFGLGVVYDLFPEAASEVIELPGFPQRLVNVAADGGYLAWRHPERRIFVDSRADLYPGRFYEQMATAFASPTALAAFEEDWRPGAFAINCCLPGAGRSTQLLMTSGRWALIYFDGVTALLVRTLAANAKLLENSELLSSGARVLERSLLEYQDAVLAGGRPPNPPRLLGAIELYGSMGLHRSALPIYQLLVRGTRGMPSALIGLGSTQLAIGDFAQAIRTLEPVARQHRKEIHAWLWLSRAYAAQGEETKARAAFARAKKLNARAAAQFGDPLEPARSHEDGTNAGPETLTWPVGSAQ